MDELKDEMIKYENKMKDILFLKERELNEKEK